MICTIGGLLATFSTQITFPFFTALISTVVACFVPSSGGQWVIQGYVTVTAATAVGVPVQQGLLALSIGDQMGNLVTPFWVAVAAGIARIDFRRFIGYQFAYAAIWFVLGVLVFTLLRERTTKARWEHRRDAGGQRGGMAAKVFSMFSSTASVDLTPRARKRSPISGVAVVASPHVPLLVAQWTEPGEVKKKAV